MAVQSIAMSPIYHAYCTPSHAAFSTRYLVSVEAVSGLGCSDVSEIDCYTVEKQPPMVTGVTVNRLNGTAMNVSWTPLNKAQSNGFIQSYTVTYSVVTAASNRKRQGNVQRETVSSDKSDVVVGGLDPASMYNVDVTVSGSGGTSERECDSYYLDGCSLAANINYDQHPQPLLGWCPPPSPPYAQCCSSSGSQTSKTVLTGW